MGKRMVKKAAKTSRKLPVKCPVDHGEKGHECWLCGYSYICGLPELKRKAAERATAR